MHFLDGYENENIPSTNSYEADDTFFIFNKKAKIKQTF